MAQPAVGTFRFTGKTSNHHEKAKTATVRYDILDNTDAPRCVLTDPTRQALPQGTEEDRIIVTPKDAVARSRFGEYLELQFYHTAALTSIDTSAFTVELNVADIYRDENGVLQIEDRPIVLSDRITRQSGQGIPNPLGWDDDIVNQAEQWSPVFRVMPPHGHNYAWRGYQRFLLDGVA